jgi:hypothetical protein
MWHIVWKSGTSGGLPLSNFSLKVYGTIVMVASLPRRPATDDALSSTRLVNSITVTTAITRSIFKFSLKIFSSTGHFFFMTRYPVGAALRLPFCEPHEATFHHKLTAAHGLLHLRTGFSGVSTHSALPSSDQICHPLRCRRRDEAPPP